METFNNHYGITDPNPGHLNIFLDADIEAFVCPFMIKASNSKFANEVYMRFKHYLTHVNNVYISKNDRLGAIRVLSRLREANEYHLGYSGRNMGKGVGAHKAELVYESLNRNEFVKQGISITSEPEKALLLVEGIGQDNMSDAIVNVCRDLFAEFTLKQCIKYNIGVFKTKIEFYDCNTHTWKKKQVYLPHHKGSAVILVPQKFTSGSRIYQERYNWHISSEYIAFDIQSGKIGISDDDDFIIELKDGRKKPVVKKIYKEYRKPKGDLISFVLAYPKSLETFIDHVKESLPPITNDQLTGIRKKAS